MDKINTNNSIQELSFSYVSGFSNGDNNWKTGCWKVGHWIFVRCNFKRNAIITANSTTNFMTLNSPSGIYGEFQFALYSGRILCVGTVYWNCIVSICPASNIPAGQWIQGSFVGLVG